MVFLENMYMFNAKNISIAALLLAAGLPAAAQAQIQPPKISGLIQVWYSQMMDNNLRHNALTGYFPLPGQFRENGLSFKRVDVKLQGGFGDIEYEVMMDPTIDNNVLQDAFIKYKLPHNVEVKLGQFKPLQTFETLTPSAEILFAERAMLVREFGDPRDRGVTVSVGFGDPQSFRGRFHVGVFNGNGKSNNTNAQSDFAARLEMSYGKPHSFGAYTLQGSTNLADKGALVPLTFNDYQLPIPLPNPDISVSAGSIGPGYNVKALPEGMDNAVLDNKDKTTNFGAYYRFQNAKIHAEAEIITGLVGRRKASLGTAPGPALREHLDQKFLGYVGTFGYTIGKHTFALRYDYLNYNSGSDWYGESKNAYDRMEEVPWTTIPGITSMYVPVDYTPKYTEITLGYTFKPMPETYKSAAIKVNYVMRSKNFLKPGAGQIGEQGGDTFVVCFQMGF